ncbi:PRK06851 family protein [Natronospora cellulosivora (SeqCode)]
MPKIKNFFPGGNTPQGFYSYYKYLAFEAEKVYIIKGGPGTGKSTFMKKIGQEIQDLGYDLEFHWCSSDNTSLDGLVIPELKTALLDGTAPHTIDPLYPGVKEKIINLGDYRNDTVLEENKTNIINLSKEISHKFTQAYSYLEAAYKIYMHWKTYYQRSRNISKYKLITNNLKKEYIIKKDISSGKERHLFASAITPAGSVNHLENLCEDIKNRIIIKGNPGTGKSELIKEFCRELEKYDYYILYLHCPLEPEELDAAIIPELDTALIVGTAPHYFEANHKGDHSINLLETCNLEYIKEHNGEILDAEKLYEDMMKRVYYFLRNAKSLHDELEKYYIEAMDFNSINQHREEIRKKILP